MLPKFVEDKIYSHNELNKPRKGITYRGSTKSKVNYVMIINSEGEKSEKNPI